MTRYFIESAKYGVGEGGFACGPVEGPVVAEVKVKTENEEFYMTLAEIYGIPNFYKSNESVYDFLVDPDIDEEKIEVVNKNFIETGDYDEIFEKRDDEWFELYRYLIYVVRADYEECDEFIKVTTGKYIDEMDIPNSDVEFEWNE